MFLPILTNKMRPLNSSVWGWARMISSWTDYVSVSSYLKAYESISSKTVLSATFIKTVSWIISFMQHLYFIILIHLLYAMIDIYSKALLN